MRDVVNAPVAEDRAEVVRGERETLRVGQFQSDTVGESCGLDVTAREREHLFRQIDRDQNFGNAREARRLLEGMRKAQSGRLRGLGRMPDRDALRTLVLDDLLAATR